MAHLAGRETATAAPKDGALRLQSAALIMCAETGPMPRSANERAPVPRPPRGAEGHTLERRPPAPQWRDWELPLRRTELRGGARRLHHLSLAGAGQELGPLRHQPAALPDHGGPVVRLLHVAPHRMPKHPLGQGWVDVGVVLGPGLEGGAQSVWNGLASTGILEAQPFMRLESVMSDSGCPFRLPGKIRPSPPVSARARSSTAIASSDRGTMCGWPVFVRSVGSPQLIDERPTGSRPRRERDLNSPPCIDSFRTTEAKEMCGVASRASSALLPPVRYGACHFRVLPSVRCRGVYGPRRRAHCSRELGRPDRRNYSAVRGICLVPCSAAYKAAEDQ